MRTLTQADRETAANIARSTRLTPSDIRAPKSVYVTGADARFAGNDEPDAQDPLSYKARVRRLEEIRADLRKVGIRTESELLQMLQCVHANTGAFALDRKAELLDLCCKLDDDVNAPPPDPEILEYGSGRERGEFDGQTRGVRNRG